MLRTEPGVVVVGASVAGLSLAEALRTEGFHERITLLGKEKHLPYNRPPLSKQVLSKKWETDRLQILSREEINSLDIELSLGNEVDDIDISNKVVQLNGKCLPFSKLVIATGVEPKLLPNPQKLFGIVTLRTIDDFEAIDIFLRDARNVAIVGAGVLGCEIASGLSARGYSITLIGRGASPKVIAGVEQVSRNLQLLMDENNVRMIMNSEVTELLGRSGKVNGLRLSSGQVVDTELVITCIGSVPCTNFLKSSNIDISDGVLCDENGSASEDVYAIGDVSRWKDPISGAAQRVEHQATAIEQSHSVAKFISKNISSGPISTFFWSEIFGNRLLVHGTIAPHSKMQVLAGELGSKGFVLGFESAGNISGLVAWNLAKEFRQERANLLSARKSLT